MTERMLALYKFPATTNHKLWLGVAHERKVMLNINIDAYRYNRNRSNSIIC